MFLIDSFSVGICWNVLIWCLFYLATGASLGHPLPTRPLVWKKRKACRIWYFQMFLIDVVSNWIFRLFRNWFLFCLDLWNVLNWLLLYFATGASLEHPLPTRPLFWKKRCTCIFGCSQTLLTDFFSIWICWNVLDWFRLYLEF